MNFTQEELQLLYAACMSYGDKLSQILKSIPNEGEIVLDSLSNRAKESWNLAQKNTSYLKESDTKIEVVEICPHCMGENILLWNIEKDGYEIICQHCGEKMMLCSPCFWAYYNGSHSAHWICQSPFRKHW